MSARIFRRVFNTSNPYVQPWAMLNSLDRVRLLSMYFGCITSMRISICWHIYCCRLGSGLFRILEWFFRTMITFFSLWWGPHLLLSSSHVTSNSSICAYVSNQRPFRARVGGGPSSTGLTTPGVEFGGRTGHPTAHVPNKGQCLILMYIVYYYVQLLV
jgi:hypothetical protein